VSDPGRTNSTKILASRPVTRNLLIPLVLLVVAAGPCAGTARAGDLTAGKAKAEAMCQTCHGVDGKATIPMAANLSGQQKEYLIAQLEAYRSGKRKNEQMAIIAKMLTDEDIENVSEWYSSIKVTIELPR
jgi:cytochrome c553